MFHSASVIYRDHADGAQDDEGDFVLVHPERGIVALEVKGGGIECRHGEWFRLDRAGKPERMRDPFTQALDHRYSLERKLEGRGQCARASSSSMRWRSRTSAFTSSCSRPTHHLSSSSTATRSRTSKARSTVSSRTTAVREIGASRPVAKPPGSLRDLLAPQIRIEVPMATMLEEEEHELILLTHEQAALMRRFGRDKRMVVTGCAGSGQDDARGRARQGARREGQEGAVRVLQQGAGEAPAGQRADRESAGVHLPRALHAPGASQRGAASDV